MRVQRTAFTLIEVLVSVVLISIVVLGVVKIREQHMAAARYLNSRMQTELANSLFLTGGLAQYNRYNGKRKSAYELVKGMNIKKDATRKILREEEREIRLSPPLPIGELPIPLQVREVTLKGDYTAHYYRVNYLK
jgi:prepilin-type N-terminal cleavage/methylation domain-containing protein